MTMRQPGPGARSAPYLLGGRAGRLGEGSTAQSAVCTATLAEAESKHLNFHGNLAE